MIKRKDEKGNEAATSASAGGGITLTAQIARNPEDFVDMFLTDTRLFQGVQEACGGMNSQLKL